jgi:predicted metalloendopeptidase
VIPPDRSGYSTGSVLTDAAQAKVRAFLEAATRQGRVGSVGPMAGDHYAAFMDEGRIEYLGTSSKKPQSLGSQLRTTRHRWQHFRHGRRFTLLDHAAPYLSRPFAKAAFELHGESLMGQKQHSPRWKHGLKLVSGGNGMTQVESAANVGDAVGQLYVSRYFQPDARVQMEALIGETKAALRARIESLTWMAPATKTEALNKLDKYAIQVGYPDHWRSYSGLRIRQDDLVGDIERASAFNWQFRVNRLHAAVDRQEWEMEPQ